MLHLRLPGSPGGEPIPERGPAKIDRGEGFVLVGGAFILLAVLMIAVASFFTLQHLLEVEDRADELALIDERLDSVLTTSAAVQASVGSYLLTGNGTYLAPNDAAKASISRDLRLLALLAPQDERLDAALPEITRVVESQQALVAEVLSLYQSGATAEAFALIDASAGGVGPQLWELIRGNQAERAAEASAARESAETWGSRTQTIVGVGVVLVLLGAGVYIWLSIAIMRGQRFARREIAKQQDFADHLLGGLSALGEGVVVTEGNRFVYANEAFYAILGTSPESMPTIEGAMERAPSEIRETLRGHAQTPGTWAGVVQLPVVWPDGTRRTAEVSAKALTIEGLTHQVAIVRDVTERKEMVEKLRQSEDRMRAILEASPDIIGIVDMTGKFVFTSRPFLPAEMDGSAPADPFDLIHPEDLPGIRASLGKIFRASDRSEVVTHTVRYRSLGADRFIRSAASPMFDELGRVVASVVILRDETEQVLAERAILESEERYRELFENAYDGIYTVDAEGRITDVNRVLERLFGVPRDDLIGRRIQDFVAPESLPVVRERGLIAARGARSSAQMELDILALNGEHVPVEVNSRAIFRDDVFVGTQGIVRDMRDRLAAERAVQESERRYRDLFQNALDFIYSVDEHGKILDVNPAMAEALGMTQGAMIGRHISEFSTAESHDVAKRNSVYASGGERDSADFEVEFVRANGTVVPVEVHARGVYSGGQLVSVQSIARDISDRRAAEELLGTIARNSPAAMYITSGGILRYVNPTFEEVSGYSADELVGVSANVKLMLEDDRDAANADIIAMLRDPHNAPRAEFRVRRKDGAIRWFEVAASSIVFEGERAMLGSCIDVTERKAAERQLEIQANEDVLTGLANRRQFTHQLERAVARNRAGGPLLAVMFLDLDDFKAVNDQYGHAAGDQLLVQVGNRLRTCVRPSDLVARLGGDEFTILLEGVATAAEAREIAHRIVSALGAPFPLEGTLVTVGASVGITFGTSPGVDASELLRQADTALYEAKAEGKGRFTEYRPGMDLAA